MKKKLKKYNKVNRSENLKQDIKIFFIYCILKKWIVRMLNLISIRSFNSLNLAFTIISSGGFLPTNELSNILKNNVQIIIFSFLLLFSYFSIFFSYNLLFIKKKSINFFYEDLHLIFYYIVVVALDRKSVV